MIIPLRNLPVRKRKASAEFVVSLDKMLCGIPL